MSLSAEQRGRWVAPAIVTVIATLAIALGALIYARVISTRMPASWDEAAHSLFALTIATDLRKGDVLALAYDTYRQTYWPPVHSWVVGLAFLVFGVSLTVARVVSLVSYVLIPIALLLGARLMHARGDRAAGWIAAAVAGLVAIAMPALVPFASIAFIDLPALLGICLTLMAAFYAERKPEAPKRRLLVGLGILICFLFKTNYGLLLMAAVGTDALIEARMSLRRLFAWRNLYVALPVLIGLVVWFAYPPKVTETINALVNVPTGEGRWTPRALLFYVSTLRTYAGSAVMLGVLLVAVVFGLRRWREPNVRILVLLGMIQFLLGELHHTKEDRHLLPVVPALVLLTAAGAARLLTRGRAAFPARLSYLPNALGAAFGALVAVQLSQIVVRPVPLWRQELPPPLGPLQQVLVTATETAKLRDDRVLIVGARGLPVEIPAIDWDLAANRRWMEVEQSGAVGLPDHAHQFALQVQRSRLPQALRSAMVRVATRGDSPSLVKTMYAGFPAAPDSVTFASWVRRTIDAGNVNVVLLATPLGQTKYPFSWFAPLVNSGALLRQTTFEVQERRRVRIDEYRVAR